MYDLTIATVLHSVVCSHCAACGLSQQVATLPELSALCYTLGYLAVPHTGDIKRHQLNRQPYQVCRLRPLQSMQSYTLLLMTMQRVLIDLMRLDIYSMATHTLADRVAECGEII